ncbi:MAG TPA: hypothetical protein VKW04_08450 [Planctomycetota bacterium]|nr:hypothetical protein [Planctomycetota bacterium]
MRLLLPGVLLAASCAAPATWVGYAPPADTPYEARPRLKDQYLRAHRAGWSSAVGSVSEEQLRKVLEGESEFLGGSTATCCEATGNVTRGWYRGAKDGRAFLEQLTGTQDPPARVLARFLRLKADLLEHPVENWFVLNGSRADQLAEVEEEGGRRIRTWQDATRTLLHSVREVKDGKNHGRHEEYDANGILTEVSTWIDGVREGPAISYADSGEVIGRSSYHQGRQEGPELLLHDDGSLKEWSSYREGRLEGLQVGWHPDGSPSYLNRFKNGQIQGRSLAYSPEGARVAFYENGERIESASDPIPFGELPEEERPEALSRLRDRVSR